MNYQNFRQAKERKSYIGMRFGRLLVLERVEDAISPKGQHSIRYRCKCDCGNETIVRKTQLYTGGTKSCGCIQKEVLGNMNRTHGLSSNCGRLYPLWKSIKYRCYNTNCKSYQNYGGRGIVMCDEWKNDFSSFYEWAISNGYKEEKTSSGINILTIDRIDVNGNYEPSNCRFVTNAEQAKNKRNSIPEEEKHAICPTCGKSFIKKVRTQKTCSYKCSFENRSKNYFNTKDYSKVCPICGKTFDAKRGGHYKDAVTCSKECARLSYSPIWEYKGKSHRVIEWAEIVGINAHCLLHRKDMGWSIEEILETPLRGKRYATS